VPIPPDNIMPVGAVLIPMTKMLCISKTSTLHAVPSSKFISPPLGGSDLTSGAKPLEIECRPTQLKPFGREWVLFKEEQMQRTLFMALSEVPSHFPSDIPPFFMKAPNSLLDRIQWCKMRARVVSNPLEANKIINNIS